MTDHPVSPPTVTARVGAPPDSVTPGEIDADRLAASIEALTAAVDRIAAHLAAAVGIAAAWASADAGDAATLDEPPDPAALVACPLCSETAPAADAPRCTLCDGTRRVPRSVAMAAMGPTS